MTITSDPELQTLHDQFDEAPAADVPNLVEIRIRKDRIYEYIARCVIDVMNTGWNEQSDRVTLRTISNDSPMPGAPRGNCSPVKTLEIRRFEDLVRKVFGDVGSCETAWVEETRR